MKYVKNQTNVSYMWKESKTSTSTSKRESLQLTLSNRNIKEVNYERI